MIDQAILKEVYLLGGDWRLSKSAKLAEDELTIPLYSVIEATLQTHECGKSEIVGYVGKKNRFWRERNIDGSYYWAGGVLEFIIKDPTTEEYDIIMALFNHDNPPLFALDIDGEYWSTPPPLKIK